MFKTIKNAITNTIDKTIRNAVTLLSRYFVNLDPILNSYYEIATPITFVGDFEIEAEFSTTNTNNQILLGDNHTTSMYFNIDSNSINVYMGGGYERSFAFGSITLHDGKLHKVKYKLTGTSLEVFLDGTSLGSQTVTLYTGANNFRIGSSNSVNQWFDGIIANAKFTDKSGASDTVTTFKLDKATANTESSIEGNNSVTYTNIPQSARDLYTLDGTTWTDAAGNTIEVAP
jgi:hypothetical protein|tara:strand:+ start:25 stop:714 length:690 start_codon:yes stop_codon:yes gene_type:complete